MMAAIVVLVATLVGTLRKGPLLEDQHRLAVLPLRFVSGEAEAPYFAEGLTDQLITTLGQIHSLKVTAQTSVARFKGTDMPAAEIARQLGVDGIVEGTVLVQKGTGNQPARARVNVRLIKAGTDLEIWSGSLERPLGDMLALESELARTITRQMRGVLTPAESANLTHAQKTDPAAEQAYFEGRTHLALFTTHAQPRWRRSSGRSPSILCTRRRTPALPGATLRWICSRHLTARGASLGRRGGDTRARARRWAGRSAWSAGRHQVFLRLGLGQGGARVPARDRAWPSASYVSRAVSRSSWRRWGDRKRPGCRPRTPRV